MAYTDKTYPDKFKPQQKLALEFLEDYLSDKNTDYAVLSGYAGTGKTYIMNYFVNHICKYATCVSAPTHKALRVIEKRVGKKGKTYHAINGLKPNVDVAKFNISAPDFAPKGQEYISSYKVIPCDEASQLGSGLINLTQSRAKQFNTKIIYIGDECQIPPRGYKNSPVFNTKNIFTLTEIIRQEESNPLLKLLRLLRSDILTGQSTFLQYIVKHREEVTADGSGYMCVDKNKYMQLIATYFNSDNFFKDVEYARLTGWTNNTILEWNKFTRKLLFNDPKPIVIEDDLLTAYTTILNEYNEPVISNSSDYIVENLRDYVDDYGIKSFAVNLMDIYTKMPGRTLQIIDHTDKSSWAKYIQILSNFHYNAMRASAHNRNEKWRSFYAFKNTYLTFIPYEINGFEVQKDIDYGYGLTVHKCQGSTLENIFVNLLDIVYYKMDKRYPFRNTDKNPNAVDMRNKLLYTALSRASKFAIILI